MSDRFDPRAFIAQAPWRFAKSMPHLPHWYVRQGDDLPANNYLELDGWRYWTMPGRGDTSTTIINRERLPGQPLRRVS
jgi:hypothetical protein